MTNLLDVVSKTFPSSDKNNLSNYHSKELIFGKSETCNRNLVQKS